MTPTETAEIADERVLPARLPGDAVDALIDGACRDLRLPSFRERFVECVASARREQASCEQFLLERLRILVTDREVRRRQRLVRAARFPGPKRLEDRFTQRAERRVIAMASNAPFGEQDRTSTGPRPCAAIADRITFQAPPVQTDTDAHRPNAAETGHRTAGRS
ncbi:hypothetical protein ACFTWS_25300 [Streptomyces sp. NPDC057027]|uniref:hypothetical protein n=1 Tax=Streptomyces sp. NPDC057027 TaxID=3346004 RepID=UPI00362C246E